MINNSLISVIIPAYNHEKYIEECIYSIINQNYSNLELFVIDDGSTDNTFEILQSLKSECKNRFISFDFQKQNNHGTSFTLNKLLDKTKGEYIYSLASDDLSKPNSIDVLHSFLSKNNDYVLAVGDDEIIDDNSKRIGWGLNQESMPLKDSIYKTFGDLLKLNGTENRLKNFGTYKELLKGNYIPNGFLVRRSAYFLAGKYNSDIPLEDWYINLQLAKLGKFKYLQDILFSYRWHNHNTVSSKQFLSDKYIIYKKIYLHERNYCFTHGLKKEWLHQWKKNFGIWSCFTNFFTATKPNDRDHTLP